MPKGNGSGKPTKKFSILFIESDSDTFDLIKRILDSHQFFESHVDRASTVKEALSKLRCENYHLVLFESDLEEEDGSRLLDQIQPKTFEFPFVMMTPVHDDELVREAMERGVADVIVKNEQHFEELSELLKKTYFKFHEWKSPSTMPESKEQSPEQRQEADGNGNVSRHDELTGLSNHSHFYDRVVLELSRAARYNTPLACLIIDIDHFKHINEKWDYRIGDQLLKECGQILFSNCRLSDFVSRFGGEEFAILLPYSDYTRAQEIAERIRVIFAERRFLQDSHDIQLTISVGISAYPEDPVSRRSDLLGFATQALYSSKAEGRNRVKLYKDLVPVFGKDELPELKISESKILEFQRRLSDIASSARRTYIEASKALIMALEDKDPFTAGHSASVAKYSLQVAQTIGMSSDDAEIVEHAALLHDVGKICIPGEVLLKIGKLTFAEFETMRQHPYLGYKILKPMKFLNQEALLVLHHHEWVNGEGYPCKLKGEDIPLGARIISVIDSYDTMRGAGGRYKRTFTVQEAVKELIDCSNVQFDPKVVHALIQVLIVRGELPADEYDKEKLEEAIRACQPKT